MAGNFNVSARLADGVPAVDNLQRYVSACHRLGYRHPDLTLHDAQLHDWYGTERGMDLAALQGDWAALDAAARATQDALAVTERQLSALPAAWQGAGADAALGVLRRHGDAAAAAAAAVRTAAEAFGALRESLWQAVETKVDAVIAIEGRTEAHRAEWLSAAGTVTTGAGDRATADEIIDQAVTPFVDSSIGTDGLAVMRAAMSSVAEAYQRATAEIAAEHQPTFEVPGDLGPRWVAPAVRAGEDRIHCEDRMHCEDRPPPAQLAGPAAAAPTIPSAWAAAPPPAAPPSAPPPVAPPPVTSEVPAAQPAPLVPPGPPMSPPMSPMGGMGSGMPDVGGGLSGLGQQFADTLGGLLGGSDGSLPEPPDLDVPELDDPLEADEEPADEKPADEEPADDEPADDEPAEEPVEEYVAAGESEPEECVEPAGVATEPAPAPTPVPPPAEPLPPADAAPADPVVAEQTPCAIAADELPQVGDPLSGEPGAG